MGAYEFQVVCPGFPMTAGNETELNRAVICFNAENTPDVYTVTLTANITLTASTVAINNANTGVSLRADGDGYAVDGQDRSGVRPFDIVAGTKVHMRDVMITGGNATGNGGGIRNTGTLTLTNSTVYSNTAPDTGGGIYNFGGLVTVVDSTISGNPAGSSSGGIHNSGTVALSGSTVSGNSAIYAGGIFNDTESIATLTNSTVSGNTATDTGGGIINAAGMGGPAARLILINSTVAGNSATNTGGGIFNTGTVTLTNSIVADSPVGGDCVIGSGTLTGTHTLIEDTDASACGLLDGDNGNIVGHDPRMGGLQDNGGPTLTHALLAGSPVIDHVSAAVNEYGSLVDTDQRGISRPQGATCDVGAYEAEYFSLTVTLAGSGTVTGTGISCGSDCSERYLEQTVVALTATADTGSTFTGCS